MLGENVDDACISKIYNDTHCKYIQRQIINDILYKYIKYEAFSKRKGRLVIKKCQ